MFKKNVYTFLALGAVITIGMATSGFISTTTAIEATPKTTVKTETLFAGTCIGGRISADGKKEGGTTGWTVYKSKSSTKTGDYLIKPDNGKIVSIVVTLTHKGNDVHTKYLVSYAHESLSKDDPYYGTANVYTYDPDDYKNGSGDDTAFSFIACVEE